MDINSIDAFLDRVEKSKYADSFPDIERLNVGVDLGTAYIGIVVLDEDKQPLTCAFKSARVLRDGVVVDFIGARDIVIELKNSVEQRMNRELTQCAIAMPAGTESSTKTHMYVAEGAGFEVINILDEPTAANALYEVKNGVVVDIGGGTTGLAVFSGGRVTKIADEATGGFHMSLVLAGSMGISYEEAEKIKLNPDNHHKIYPILKPVMEKMATIVSTHIAGLNPEVIYLCGGTCAMYGIEQIFEKITGIKTIKPAKPFLVTPTGIAMNCFKT